MNFTRGQKVVCIDAKPIPGSYHSRTLIKGQVYTIREMLEWHSPTLNEVRITCRLEEITDRPGDVPYLAERFRPVKTTDISIFTKMLAPTPKEPANV